MLRYVNKRLHLPLDSLTRQKLHGLSQVLLLRNVDLAAP